LHQIKENAKDAKGAKDAKVVKKSSITLQAQKFNQLWK